jgi:hypothetical protein
MNQIKLIALFVFLVSFITRIIIIQLTPFANSYADISCLVNGGQMISNGINPYNFEEDIALRNELRLDPIGDNSWLCSEQSIWNYHSANNLPFNLLFNGAIDYIFNSNVYFYRYTYALIDSLIGYIATLLLFTLIRLPVTWVSILFTLFVSGLSPLIMLNGTLIPEDKGFQVLLMLLALWFSIHKEFFKATLSLSLAIGFKAIGIIVAPICLFYYVLDRETFQKIPTWWGTIQELFKSNERIKKSLYYLAATAVFFLVFFLPYAKGFSSIASQRILYEIENAPNHSSLWLPFYYTFPEDWATIRLVVLWTLSLTLVAAFLKNLIPLDIFILCVLVMFLCVTFLTGSLDRNNMAMQPAIFYMALRWRKESVFLGWYYIIGGMLLLIPVGYKHFIDDDVQYAYYSSIFVLFYCIIFYYIVISKAIGVYKERLRYSAQQTH